MAPNNFEREVASPTDQIPATSRGQFVEMEESVSNMMGAVEHLLDLPYISEVDREFVARLRSARARVMGVFASEDEVNIQYHCAYKHVLLAKMQLRELIQSRISYGLATSELESVVESIEEVLSYIRKQYYKIPDDGKNAFCIRCVEDYFLNSKQRKLMQDISPYSLAGNTDNEPASKAQPTTVG